MRLRFESDLVFFEDEEHSGTVYAEHTDRHETAVHISSTYGPEHTSIYLDPVAAGALGHQLLEAASRSLKGRPR